MDLATALIAENAAFADLLRDADLSIPVPTCPEWTLEQLMRHVGRGDRWCGHIVAEQSMDFIDPRTVEGGKPPAGRDNEIAWLQAGPRQLIDAVAATGAETEVWTFLGPRPAQWWIRRRLHEVVVHRADAAIALGVDYIVEPALAADAITEWLERIEIQADDEGPAGGDRPLGDEQSIHLHATDSGLGEAGEWTILGRRDGIAVEQGHGKATVALRGPARDLLLAVVRRRTAAEEGIEIFGNAGVWDTWLARTPF
ncbi:maleylpyruvate isomerase family mycothiol-dependent enzyme [Mycolicibacterium sp. P1-5]|uniref:maleylpyruvate isomerase family mycothiol-dependent enzyme n=1 Tax=Mycolicibacterium sp. P1-5 TaxID=2024617 RepID=UPI0011ECBDC2|nr:maleylpyruvate isomerase family mycothiol-dependent enzyme [Mycolicibacterium sp. P1-5]KAA0111341.1 maleylpyruvate isomerase family mycothiol-dependent enzyme [Mycolicibacterium sp. P1-5]